MEQYKTCTVCKQALPIGNFHKNKRSPDGLLCRCKTCQSKAMKISRAKHSEKNKKNQADWVQRNPEKVALKAKRWRDKNKESIRAKGQIKYKNNSEKIKQYKREKYANNENVRLRNKINYKLWAASNPEKIHDKRHRRRNLEASVVTKKITKSEILKLKRSSCFYCKKFLPITIDHVIPLSRGGYHGIGNLLPACKSCNSSKGTKTIMEWKKVRGW